MHDIGEGTIRRIDWMELTPIVLLLRVFNIAFGMRILLIALIGLQLTVWFNHITGVSFLDSELTEQVQQGTPHYYANLPIDMLYLGIVNIIQTRNGLWVVGFALIWILCGGMISRIVAVRLTIDESESTSNLFLFFRKRGIGFVSAPIIMLLGILCCFLPVKISGWLLAIPGLNYVAATFFPIPFLFAILTVILSVMLVVGWMLLFAAVSTDGSDGFDAISRMFSYIYQRPLHYFMYWLCCGILGYLGFLLIQFVIINPAVGLCWRTIPDNSVSYITFWASLFALIPLAYLFAWFWTSSVAIYLLLRRSVDATPFSEIYRVMPPQARLLPAIKQDEHGAPEIRS